jgi:hypothetical protein
MRSAFPTAGSEARTQERVPMPGSWMRVEIGGESVCSEASPRGPSTTGCSRPKDAWVHGFDERYRRDIES